MYRRKFLTLTASAGVGGLAGCSESNPETESPPPSPSNSSPTPSSTATATETDTPTETETDTPTETETDTPTEEPTPSAAERARSHMDAAASELDEAVRTYAEAAGDVNVTIQSVTASTAFDAGWISEQISAATEETTKAEQYATAEQTAEVTQLQHMTTWLRFSASAQEEIYRSFGVWEGFRSALYGEELDKLQQKRENLASGASRISNRLENATEDATASDTKPLGELTAAAFDSKTAQLWADKRSYRLLGATTAKIRSALSNLQEGTEAYRNGNYTAASAPFFDARTESRDAASALEEGDVDASELGAPIETLACIFRSIQAGADEMEQSLEAGRNGYERSRQRHLELAKEELTGCGGRVKELPTVQAIHDLN